MLKKVWNWIKKSVDGALKFLRPKAETAIAIVNAVKATVENPLVGYVVSLTPTKADDAVLLALNTCLPKIAEEMLVAERVLKAGNTPEAITNALIDFLRSKSKEARAKFWVELQAKLTVALADGKISLEEAIAIGQLMYKEIAESK